MAFQLACVDQAAVLAPLPAGDDEEGVAAPPAGAPLAAPAAPTGMAAPTEAAGTVALTINDNMDAEATAPPAKAPVATPTVPTGPTSPTTKDGEGEEGTSLLVGAPTAAATAAPPAGALAAAPSMATAAEASATAVTDEGAVEGGGAPPSVPPSQNRAANGGGVVAPPVATAMVAVGSGVQPRPAASTVGGEPPAAAAAAGAPAGTDASRVSNGAPTPAGATGGEPTVALPARTPAVAAVADAPAATDVRSLAVSPKWRRDYPPVEAAAKRLAAEDDAAWTALLAAAAGDGHHHVALRALRAALTAAGVGGVRGHALVTTLRGVELPAADWGAEPLTLPASLTASDVVAAVRAGRAAGAVHRYELSDDTGAFTTGGGALFVARATTAAFRVYPYRVVRPPQSSSSSRPGRSSRVVQFDHAAGVPLAPLSALDGSPDEALTADLRGRLLAILMRTPGASQAVVLAAVRRTDVPARAVLSQLAALERAGRVSRTCVGGLLPRAAALSAAIEGVGDRSAARRALAAQLAAPAGGVVAVPPPSLADLEDDVPEIMGTGRGLVTHYWVTARAVDTVPLWTN